MGASLGFVWLTVFLTLVGPARVTASEQPVTCLSEPPGNADRTSVSLKVGHRSWLSHELVAYVAEIVLDEFLGFTVEDVAAPGSTSDWGEDISNGFIDMDLEQWQAPRTGASYNQYVLQDLSVLDAGVLGYSGRSGLFTPRAALQQSLLADYYKYFQNSTVAKKDGFLSFSESELPERAGDSFPFCDVASVSWCGEGSLTGYWAPPACLADPTECIEIAAATPGWDTSYFEQLVRNTGVRGIFAYYGGGGMPGYVIDMVNSGSSVVFYWYQPDPLLVQVDAVRISFPDFYYGCDRFNNKDANTGPVSCDYGENALRKLVSSRVLEAAPEAYYFLSRLQILMPQMNALMLSTAVAGGTYSSFQAACEFIKENVDLIGTFAPRCLTHPPVVVTNGDEVFNRETMQCENATILVTADPMPSCFAGGIAPGSADRRDQKVRVVRRNWLTHDLISSATEVVLRDYYGFTVIAVQSGSGSSEWGQDMIDLDLYDVDMEQWQVAVGSPNYERYVLTDNVLIAGEIGFPARSGVYVSKDAVAQAPMSTYYKFYLNATSAASEGFVLHRDSALSGSSCELDWCGANSSLGYWAPDICKADPARCIELIHQTTDFDTGYVEQMVQNNGLEVIVGYYGFSGAGDAVLGYVGSGKAAPFYWWEPDVFITQVDAVRVSFPDYFFGCAIGNTLNPDTGSVACDFAELSPVKITTARLLSSIPAAYYALQQIQFFRSDIDDMLSKHEQAGGDKNSTQLVCDFITSHTETLQLWAPDCLSHPIPFEEMDVSSVVFDPEQLRCGPVKQCPNHTVLRFQSIFYCDPCGSGQVPNSRQSACQSCPMGEEVSADGSHCSPCARGFAKASDADACAPCPLGRFAASEGQSDCTFCNSTNYQNATGQPQCEPCDAIISGSVTPFLGATDPSQCHCGSGFFLPLAGQACVECYAGMVCEAGSAMVNLPSTNTSVNGPFPRVQPGYMTRVDAPLQVYLCKETSHCPGGSPASCAAFRDAEKVACGECKDGSYESSGACKECGGADWAPAVVSIVVAFAGACVAVMVVNKNILMKSSAALLWTVLLGLVMTTLQTLVVFRRMSVDWFDPLTGIFDALSFVSFDLDIVRVACIVGSGRVRGYLMRQLIAPLSVPVLWVLLLVRKRMFKPNSHVSVELTNSVGTIFNIFFISIVVSAVGPFVCYSHPGDSGRSVVSEPSILCSFDGEHIAVVSIGMTASLLVPLPFLILIIYGVCKYPQAVRHQLHSDTFQAAFRFLFVRFNATAYWFGIVVAMRSLLLCLTPVAFEDPALQVVCMSLLLSAYIIVQQTIRPWRSNLANFVDLALSQGLLLLLLCISVVTEFSGGVDAVKIAATLGLIATALTPAIIAAWVQHQQWKAARFDYFICHHKAGGGAQARLMKMLLVAKTRTNVFIDSDNLVELDGLFDIVKSKVRILVVYLTRETLTRPWCVGEICTSFESKKKVITVQTASWEPPVGDAIDLMPSLIDKKSCNLQEQGISEQLIDKSLRQVISEDTPTIIMDNSLLGSKKYMDVASQLAELVPSGRTILQSKTTNFATSASSFATMSEASSSVPDSPTSSPASPRATSKRKKQQQPEGLRVEPGGLLACADPHDDEAVAAINILIKKVNEHVVSFVGSGFVETTEFAYHELLEDILIGVENARAVVVLLTRRTLEVFDQVSVIVVGMKVACTMIPVNTWDFSFPSASYYDNQLQRVWPPGVAVNFQEAQAHVRNFFKLITVALATMASDQVLDTNAMDVVGRVPRDFDAVAKARARSKSGASSFVSRSIALGRSNTAHSGPDRPFVSEVATARTSTMSASHSTAVVNTASSTAPLAKMSGILETNVDAKDETAEGGPMDMVLISTDDEVDGIYPHVHHFQDPRGINCFQIDFT